MLSRKSGVVALTLSLVLLLLSSACSQAPQDARPMVLSSTSIINDAVKVLAGDHVQAVSLMGPGVDPHLYKASQGDVKRLTDADLIFYNGLHLEAKMSDVFKKIAKTKPCYAVAEAIPKNQLITPPDYAGNADPHLWFDLKLWRYAIQAISQGLQVSFPEFSQDIRRNESAYLLQLSALDAQITQAIKRIPVQKRVLITAHDAFSYFGKAYGMEVMGLQGISTASEAGTKDIQRLTQVIVNQGIPSIFVESSVPVRQIKALQAAVEAKGKSVAIGEELYTDALGSPDSRAATYLGMLKHNMQAIVHGLKQ
eukprot:COSAG01_NODE_547_length_15635_cov_102.896498_12_plen_310_part_00